MDRGRVKKIKPQRLIGADNPGFNPFQESQGQMNRRWVNGGGNNGGGRQNYQIFRQNSHHNHHRNYNTNFRGRHQNRNYSRPNRNRGCGFQR